MTAVPYEADGKKYLVGAFTCTPVDRPWVASNRFEMNWNSAIESWLKRG